MNTSTTPPRDRATTPAPTASVAPELAAYIRASERVGAALRDQRTALEALKTFEHEVERTRSFTILPRAVSL